MGSQASPSSQGDTLERFHRRLSKGGGGTVLYLPADLARSFHLEPGTPVEMDVEIVDGGLQLSVRPQPRFSREELTQLAEEEGWEMIADEDRGNDERSLEFETAHKVRVRVESKLVIGNRPVNNVFVEGPALPLDDEGTYNRLRRLATENDLSIDVYDEEGLWERLVTSNVLTPSDPPEPEQMATFLNATSPISISFVHRGSTLALSLSHLQERSEVIGDATREANEILT